MARFLTALIALAATVGLASPALAADPIAGARLFKAQCGLCHAASGSGAGVGPSLAGVVGRKAGTQAAFASRYSPAMKTAGLTWAPENLELYVSNPAKVVPGNRMPFAGMRNPGQVADLVAYLATLR